MLPIGWKPCSILDYSDKALNRWELVKNHFLQDCTLLCIQIKHPRPVFVAVGGGKYTSKRVS